MGSSEPAKQEGGNAPVDSSLVRPGASLDAARFEDILTRLGTVVDKLEAGDLPLEDSLLLFEEGVRLSRLGAARLDEAERRVERLLRGEDKAPSLDARQKENEAP